MNHKVVAIPHQEKNLFTERATIKNFSLNIFKSKIDKQLFLKIIDSTEEELQQLLLKYPDQVKIAKEEIEDGKIKPTEGRTVYLILENPIKKNGQILTILRFKGTRPRITENGSVAPYSKGAGFVKRVLTIEKNGNLSVEIHDETHPELKTNPTGTMFDKDANNENAIMKDSPNKKYSTDVALCKGTYNNLLLNNEPVAFVVCGMTEEDVRITFERNIRNPNSFRTPYLKNIFTGKTTRMEKQEVEQLYHEIGKSFRAYHNDGKYHKYAHPLNIGVIKNGDDFQIILRDLNTTIHRALFSGSAKNKTTQEATARFLDLSRLIYDLSIVEPVWRGSDEEESIDATIFIKQLLEGYFPELAIADPAGLNRLIAFCKKEDFAIQIANLVSPKAKNDSEIMGPNNKFFGKLWEQLYSLSSTPTGPTVATE